MRILTDFGRLAAWLELVAAVGVVALEAGIRSEHPWEFSALELFDTAVVALFAMRIGLRIWRNWRVILTPQALAAIVAVAVFSALWLRVAAVVALVHDGVAAIAWLRRARARGRVLVDVGQRPARSLVLSFVTLIAVGTVLLAFPAAARNEPVSILDAFFTAVSATCVTGLVTVDTSIAWSPFGLGVILVLFQLGGLGIMAIAAAVTLSFGQELGLRETAVVQGALDESDAAELRATLKALVVWTLVIEAVGAALLFARFVVDMPAAEAATSAMFHSISAFCNAGFSLYSDSLVRFADDPAVNGIVTLLIIMGGLGFGVLVAVGRLIGRRKIGVFPVHAKIVLVSSLFLVWFGALAYFFFEYDHSLADLDFGGKVMAAIFQSVTTRTAGFNTVSLDALHPATLLVMIVLMFIGASPGSTGGGVKTTTVVIMFLALRSILQGRPDVEVFGRRLPPGLVLRALVLTGGAAAMFMLGFGILLVTESHRFELLAFETGSALGTVGLTLGVTPSLSVPGKLVVACLMFAGRVGPLTAMSALAKRSTVPARVRLPEGKLLVG